MYTVNNFSDIIFNINLSQNFNLIMDIKYVIIIKQIK